jgi:hypothetical protein
MQKSNVRRLLFPAITASTIVFGLTLLFMGTHKSELFEQVAKTRNEDLNRDYTLTHRGRDAAIRVVGSAIVLSVATGILTVEVLRKWYSYRESIDQKAEDLGLAPFMVAESDLESALLNEAEPPIAPMLDLQRSEPPINPLEWHQLQWHQSSILDHSDPIPGLSPVRELTASEGKTDRVLSPNSLQTHYVLDHENQRYRFLRTAANRSKMLRYSTLVQSQGQEIIVKLNPDGESYSLWTREPSPQAT